MSFGSLLTVREKLRREFRAARDAGSPWHDLLGLLDASLEGAENGDEAMDIQEAADGAGLSLVMSKRYRAALARTQAIASETSMPLERLLSPSFALQELALRLYERSPKEGLDILLGTAAGQFRLSELRDRLSRLSSSARSSAEAARVEVVRAKTAGRSAIDRALKDSAVTLWGAGSRIVRRPRLRYVSRDGYEVIARDGTIAAGVDVIDVGVRVNRDRVAQDLPHSLLMASFFPEFLIACAAANGAAERTVEVLEWLDAGSVGVLAVQSDGSVRTVREPKGPPVPDRVRMYEALKRRFASRSGDAVE